MKHDFITYYSDIWLEDESNERLGKNQKEYFDKTLNDGKTDNDSEELKYGDDSRRI